MPALMSSCVVVVVAMVAAINLALPKLSGSDLHPSSTQLLWIVEAYILVFGGLLIPAGSLADRFGRKGVLLTGLGTVRHRLPRLSRRADRHDPARRTSVTGARRRPRHAIHPVAADASDTVRSNLYIAFGTKRAVFDAALAEYVASFLDPRCVVV